MCVLQFLINHALEIAAAAAAFFALRISIISNRKTISLQIINELYNEYRSVEMFNAIKELWRFYTEDCKEDEKILIENYIERCKKERKNDKQENTLNFMRRRVSIYYQIVASYYNNKLLPRRLWKKIRTTIDLNIIVSLLKPLEWKAVSQVNYYKPGLIGEKPPSQVKLMMRMYEKLSMPFFKRLFKSLKCFIKKRI